MGPERKSRIPDEEANLITAYHEGGHTIVAHYTQDAHPLHKVRPSCLRQIYFQNLNKPWKLRVLNRLPSYHEVHL